MFVALSKINNKRTKTLFLHLIFEWNRKFLKKCFKRDFYLNAGIGIPCAGHVRAMPAPSFISKADRDKMDENFGFEKPIGSKETRIERYTNISWIHSTERLYLNDGRGEACAGHDNDKDKPNGFWYVSDFLVLENLGAVPPTGSISKGNSAI